MSHRLLAIAFAVLTLTACKSDEEKVRETLDAFTSAVAVHRAPYNAYVHLAADDKRHVSLDSFVTDFERSWETFGEGARVTIGDVSLRGERAESVVKITTESGGEHAWKYVLIREGTKWRVLLDLPQLAGLEQKLETAKRLAADGAIPEALENVEEVAQTPFKGSRPEVLEAKTSALRTKLQQMQATSDLDARVTKAIGAPTVAQMKTELVELEKEIQPDDPLLGPRLAELRREVAKREIDDAVVRLVVEDLKFKRFRDAWGMFREVRFEIANTTERPLSRLQVKIAYQNQEGGEAVGFAMHELVEPGTVLEPGGTVEFQKEIEKAPQTWNSEFVDVTVHDVAFAGEDSRPAAP